MDIKKCDICGKELDSKNKIGVFFLYYKHVDLCDKCASPILRFLGKNKLYNKIEFEKETETIKDKIFSKKS